MRSEGQEESDAMGFISETCYPNPSTGLVKSGKSFSRGLCLLLELLSSAGGQSERLACLSSTKAQLGLRPHCFSPATQHWEGAAVLPVTGTRKANWLPSTFDIRLSTNTS